MKTFKSKPPSKKPATADRPSVFTDGLVEVIDKSKFGYYVVDLRHLELDEKQASQIEKQIQETVIKNIGRFAVVPEHGFIGLGGHLAGMYIDNDIRFKTLR